MADPRNADSYILKILSGVQTGVEVLLSVGEYTLGSGNEDDIQLVDLSLKPGHARIRLSAGVIEVSGLAGSLKTSAGLTIGAGSDWNAIAPLDVVTAGTSRFALGPPNAQWTTLADAGSDAAAARRPAPKGPEQPGRRLFWNVAAVAAVAGLVLWFVLQGQTGGSSALNAPRDDFAVARQAVAGLPFASRVRVTQDLDGVIFVTGHVDSPVQRRALIGALEQAGSPARVRIWVTETMRADLDALIQAERLPLTAQVAADGSATLDGLILSDASARRFAGLVQSQVLGLTRLDMRVRTAETLLGAVRDLARQSQIGQFVIFRLDRELIEANGVLPNDRIDAWVGFLQAFAQRHAGEIGLRSFVQLQSAGGGRPDRSIGIGRGAEGDIILDADRLRQGLYGPRELFAPPPPAATPQAAAPPAQRETVAGFVDRLAPRPPQGPRAGSLRRDDEVGTPARPNAPDPSDQFSNAARSLVERWRDGQLDNSPAGQALGRALDALANARRGATGELTDADRRALAAQLVPIFADPRRAGVNDSCWRNSRLTRANLQAALFWLDLASVSEHVTVRSLGLDLQGLVLEAALNPGRVSACNGGGGGRTGGDGSIYLAETQRNPAFVRFVTRDLGSFQLDVAGASLRDNRFILTRAGERLFEGAAPDAASRVALVGELGAAIQQRDGLSVVIFGPQLNWFVGD